MARKRNPPKRPPRPLPEVLPVTRAEVNLLRPPPTTPKGPASGYRFVYLRQVSPNGSNLCSEVCRTVRVRLKNNCDANGRAVYEDFSAKWSDARSAAEFAAGLLKKRYGADWVKLVEGGRFRRPPVWRVHKCYHDAGRYWLTVQVEGRWYRVRNPGFTDGGFNSVKHARWFLLAWTAAKFGQAGLSACGFGVPPAGTLTEKQARRRLPETPRRWQLRQLAAFAVDITEDDIASIPWVETLDKTFRAERSVQP